jgi:hypothetical protein
MILLGRPASTGSMTYLQLALREIREGAHGLSTFQAARRCPSSLLSMHLLRLRWRSKMHGNDG